MRGYFGVGLHHPKTPENIAGVLRACGCYGAAMLAVTGRRYEKRSLDTTKHWRHMPLMHLDEMQIPFGADAIAVDLVDGAIPLPKFTHPESAFYIFGPEDGTLGQDIIKRCRYKVMVPTRVCMNLAACVNVVLYDRMAKQ